MMLRLKNLPGLFPLPTNALPPKPIISSRVFSSKAASLPSSSASLLTTFRGYDIPEEETNAIVAQYPWHLTLKLDMTLRPKLDFLRGAGFTGADLAQILLTKVARAYQGKIEFQAWEWLKDSKKKKKPMAPKSS